MVRMTPPMGWNSWNTFGDDINEKLIFEVADVLVESGLRDLGYDYLVIDDCWDLRTRDEKGHLVPDPEKFPNGMKAVADYIHDRGLKFGMYSCAGVMTCAGYPGSYEHEYVDAADFAAWGVDYLKYDYCFHSPLISGEELYRRMGIALRNSGRDILLAACSWGADETPQWIRETGAGTWRSTGDIFDTWESIKDLAKQQEKIHPFGGLGCFNDMDMLVVGMYGKGNVGLKGCTDIQYKTHFSLWAFLGSPLMIGCDVRSMNEETRKILSNRELIAINQDEAFSQPVRISSLVTSGDLLCYLRVLDNGDLAIGYFNLGAESAYAMVSLEMLGIPGTSGKTLELTDLWTQEKSAPVNGLVAARLEAFGCAVYRAKIVETA